MPTDNVLIVDFGSQTTQLIARRVRELNVYCEIHPCTASFEKLRAFDPGAVILSGGPASVYDDGAPTIDPAIFELGVPVLGICYGMQLTAHLLGGKVQPSNHREFGQAKVTLDRNAGSKLFGRLASETEVEVWMSHGDQVLALPAGFVSVGKTSSTPNAVVANPERRIFGLQFHPEVVHTPKGPDLLAAFLFDVAGLSATWTPDTFVQDSIEHIKSQVGDGHAICGLSGGVDSTVAAVLVERAIKERLTCVFVDHGLMRLNEGKEVVQMFKEHVPSLKLIAVDAKARFMSELHGVTDPETKRKIIGRVFIEVFEAEAKKISGTTHLVQGTLYPDVIESVSFKGPSVTIKSHHNVGGLPERMNLKLCEPLRELFKDEVRAAGEILGIPRHVLYRHPFPGPGLAIRCLGDLTESRLDTLRHADAIFIDELKKQNLYDSVWQAFCVLLPVRTVGVMGDGRTYDEVLALRAVSSRDGMTADWSRLPHEFLAQVSLRITNEVRGINRVVLDISGKPPATIEWE